MPKVSVWRLPDKQVLVTFYTWLEDGETDIEFRGRNDAAIEARHTEQAAKIGVDAGRLHRGKPDSGQIVFNNVKYASIAYLLEDLRAQGFRMVDAWRTVTRRAKPGPGDSTEMKKVVFSFSVTGNPYAISDRDLVWFERKCAVAYEVMSIFANPKTNGSGDEFTWRQDTINCRGAEPETRPRKFVRMPELGQYKLEEA